MSVKKILILHGPNLNLLGTRESEIYGSQTLEQINKRLEEKARAAKASISFFQSNAEHELIARIQQAKGEGCNFIIINPAAFTHTSVALLDALAAVSIPFIEVHLSNVHSREEFRRHSYFSPRAIGTITGLGALGYEFAVEFALRK
ncbi:MAG: type II 3-dehydroquinate dehydratase [Burkholderiales bacterium]